MKEKQTEESKARSGDGVLGEEAASPSLGLPPTRGSGAVL